MILILLAPLGIARRHLDMPVLVGTDPDVGPGGRDHQRTDALQRVLVADRLSVGTGVAEALAGAMPANTRLFVGGIAQPDRLGGLARLGKERCPIHPPRKP